LLGDDIRWTLRVGEDRFVGDVGEWQLAAFAYFVDHINSSGWYLANVFLFPLIFVDFGIRK